MKRCTPNRPTKARQSGLSLIEGLIGLAVTAVAVGGALPGLKSSLERRHLDGAAAQLATDIQFARSVAVAQNRTLRLSFRSDAAGSCYLVHSGSADACRCGADGLPVCTAGASVVRTVQFTGPALRLNSNVNSMVFEPIKGTVTPTATMRLQGQTGRTVHLVINIMGRVRACSPAPALSGYEAC